MRIRPLVLSAVLAGAVVLGAAGCSSSGSASSKAPAGKPTGTVTVMSGGKVVCTITLDQNGTGTCKVSNANDKPGQITYTGSYNGDGSYKSGTGAVTITLKPAQQTS
jgi:predicted lipoprotein with Yx(FWY)xxD motif